MLNGLLHFLSHSLDMGAFYVNSMELFSLIVGQYFTSIKAQDKLLLRRYFLPTLGIEETSTS